MADVDNIIEFWTTSASGHYIEDAAPLQELIDGDAGERFEVRGIEVQSDDGDAIADAIRNYVHMHIRKASDKTLTDLRDGARAYAEAIDKVLRFRAQAKAGRADEG